MQDFPEEFSIQVRYLRRSRRTTLRVLPGKIIRVTAPCRFPEAEIKKFIIKNRDWILKRHEMIEDRPAPKKLAFANSEVFRFRGNEYLLSIQVGRQPITIHNNLLMISVPLAKKEDSKYIQKKIMNWYQQQAAAHLQKRVRYYSDLLQVKEKSFALKNYKSRWGCCSAKGDLIFNWQIITFSDEMLDYVVAHEVCHIKEMNHGEHFYEYLFNLGFEKNRSHALMRSAQNLFIR